MSVPFDLYVDVYASEMLFLHVLVLFIVSRAFYLSVPRRTRRQRNLSSVVESEELNSKTARPIAGKMGKNWVEFGLGNQLILVQFCSLVLVRFILLKLVKVSIKMSTFEF